MQWGYNADPGVNVQVDITFPITFSNLYSILATSQKHTYAGYPYVESKSTSGCTIKRDYRGYGDVFWFVTGKKS